MRERSERCGGDGDLGCRLGIAAVELCLLAGNGERGAWMLRGGGRRFRRLKQIWWWLAFRGRRGCGFRRRGVCGVRRRWTIAPVGRKGFPLVVLRKEFELVVCRCGRVEGFERRREVNHGCVGPATVKMEGGGGSCAFGGKAR